ERLVDFDVAAHVRRGLVEGGKGGRARLQPFSLDGEVHDQAPDVELVVLGAPQAGQVGARIGARKDLDVAVAPTEPQFTDVVLVAQALHGAREYLRKQSTIGPTPLFAHERGHSVGPGPATAVAGTFSSSSPISHQGRTAKGAFAS